MNYKCKYELYHDKPVQNNEPSSNNGWIYTAYAYYLGMFNNPMDFVHYSNVYAMCVLVDHPLYWVTRLPEKMFPPISRDEIMGMYILGVLPFKKLKERNFCMIRSNFVKFDLVKAVKSLWEIRNKHRNYAWENKMYHVYPVVFKLYWHDQYFFRKTSGVIPGIFETICFYLYMISTIIKKDPGELNLLWVQLKHLNSKYWIKLIDQKKSFREYFGKDHIFNSL